MAEILLIYKKLQSKVFEDNFYVSEVEHIGQEDIKYACNPKERKSKIDPEM